MFSSRKLFAAAVLGAAFFVPSAHARQDMDVNKFVQMCDTNQDGMVSKAEVMKQVEKMFDKHDTKKRGMLDKTQAELFLIDFMKMSGG